MHCLTTRNIRVKPYQMFALLQHVDENMEDVNRIYSILAPKRLTLGFDLLKGPYSIAIHVEL